MIQFVSCPSPFIDFLASPAVRLAVMAITLAIVFAGGWLTRDSSRR